MTDSTPIELRESYEEISKIIMEAQKIVEGDRLIPRTIIRAVSILRFTV